MEAGEAVVSLRLSPLLRMTDMLNSFQTQVKHSHMDFVAEMEKG